jgi:hypothetical protein
MNDEVLNSKQIIFLASTYFANKSIYLFDILPEFFTAQGNAEHIDKLLQTLVQEGFDSEK